MSLDARSNGPEEIVERVRRALKGRYRIVDISKIRGARAWLLMGLLAGITSGVLFVANRSGDFSFSFAKEKLHPIPSQIELDLPDYYPESLMRPQHLFAGRSIRIKVTGKADPKQGVVLKSKGGKELKNLKVKDKKRPGKETDLVVELDKDIKTGNYEILYTDDAGDHVVPISVVGFEPNEILAPIAPYSDSKHISTRGKICEDGCYWEMVMSGNPRNSQELVESSLWGIARSTDGGSSWRHDEVSQISDFQSGTFFVGDPKLLTRSDGTFLLSGLSVKSAFNRGMYIGSLAKGGFSGNLHQTMFQDFPSPLPPDWVWIVADYPKLAENEEKSEVYISANAAWFTNPPPGDYGYGLYISKDKGETFKQYKLQYEGSAIFSMTVARGTLFAGFSQFTGAADYVSEGKLLRFRSTDPPEFDILSVPGSNPSPFTRISNTSNRNWLAYYGPEVVADNNPLSPHYGRLYYVWSEPERRVSDPNYEYQNYGYNYDIFVSYSDNQGDSWSSPVKVNDDIGAGDQIFPSVRVDSKGVLHMAFIDHRDNQDLPVFDTYYAFSSDGGSSFSRNIRLNESPAANGYGGRSIGDYLDMVVPYEDKVYVGFPCGVDSSGTLPKGTCMVTLKDGLPPPPVPTISMAADRPEVYAGEVLNIQWTNTRTTYAKDWIAMIPKGGNFIDATETPWFHTDGLSQGSKPLTAPTKPGTYEFRYYENNGFTLRAVSGEIIVRTRQIEINPSVPQAYGGETIQVSWINPDAVNAKDWIALIPKDGKFIDGEKTPWFYTGGLASGTKSLVMPAAPGIYVFVHYKDNGYVEYGRGPEFLIVEGTAPLTIYPSQPEALPGQVFDVTWKVTSPTNAKDWIALVKVGGEFIDGTETPWFHTDGLTEGTKKLTAPNSAGKYEFRYYVNNGFTIRGSVSGMYIGERQ